jgi:hypothetical protein
MKKSIYYRACKDENGFTFQACEGYLINFYNGASAIDLVFGKNQYNRWTITELSTGFLVHNSSFSTRKEAIEAVTDEYFKKIVDKMQEWQFYPDAVQRLAEYRAKNQV